MSGLAGDAAHEDGARVGCAEMAPEQPSTDQAVSASSRKMTSGSGGAQARIRWASMTACSWLRLGARKRRPRPGWPQAWPPALPRRSSVLTSADIGRDLSVSGVDPSRRDSPEGTLPHGHAFGLG